MRPTNVNGEENIIRSNNWGYNTHRVVDLLVLDHFLAEEARVVVLDD